MELGTAKSISVKQISGDFIENEINDWLNKNPETEVIDIKFSASATDDNWGSDVLIIYRENK